MNQLKVHKKHSIGVLRKQGLSMREIARKLEIDRGTVRRYLKHLSPKAAISPIGSVGVEPASNAAISPHGSSGRRSDCEPFREQILQWLKKGLSAQRIYQDLVSDHGFKGSYDSVKRFVRHLNNFTQLPFRRMECDPGDEAQVDFGQGSWTLVDGKRKRPHLFRIVLSHYRKGYSEVVWRQTTDAFIRCLENAFRYFGGVPKTLIIDNLAAAVRKADWFDPEINPKVRSFCEHYRACIMPTKVATPRHKGKIESGVKYAQNNGLKGRKFNSLNEQNEFLIHWEKTVADTRIHGTIRQQVGQCFEELEQSHLLKLPMDLFPMFSETQRKVHRDGYVELQRAYYSVPPEYVGRTVWVRWDARMMRVFNKRMESVCVHALSDPGRFNTDPNHIHDRKRCLVERGADWMLDRCRLIGKYSGTWAEALFEKRGPQCLRVLQGLLQLAEKYPVKQLEKACERAIHHGCWRLKELRHLMDQDTQSVQSDFLEEHPLIRDLQEYGDLFPTSFNNTN